MVTHQSSPCWIALQSLSSQPLYSQISLPLGSLFPFPLLPFSPHMSLSILLDGTNHFCSPYPRFQNGVIVVASLQPGGGSQILQKLKGHDDEVQCLKWSTLIRGLRAQPAEGMKSGSSEKPNKQTEAKGKRKAKRNHSEVASQQPDPSQHQVDPAGKKAKLEPPLNPGNQRIDVEAPEKTTPEPGNLVPEPEESPLPPMIYLASSSRDKTLRVWNPENGQMSWVLNLPREGGGGGNDAKSRQWTSVDWSHPSRLELIFFGGK